MDGDRCDVALTRAGVDRSAVSEGQRAQFPELLSAPEAWQLIDETECVTERRLDPAAILTEARRPTRGHRECDGCVAPSPALPGR